MNSGDDIDDLLTWTVDPSRAARSGIHLPSTYPPTRHSAYTAAEVAAARGVTVRTVTKWAQEGLIPAFRVSGGYWQFPPAAMPTPKDDEAETAP